VGRGVGVGVSQAGGVGGVLHPGAVHAALHLGEREEREWKVGWRERERERERRESQ